VRQRVKGRILLIDDHDAARRGLARSLGEVYEVVEAPSCEEALDVLENSRRPFDLVLVDPAFPEGQIRGEAALGHIGSRCPELPLIVMGSRRESGTMERVIQAGAADYVVKDPDDMGVLCIRLRHHLERVFLRRENHELREHVKQLRAQADGAAAPPDVGVQPLPEVMRRHIEHALSVHGTQKGAAAALKVDYYRLRRILKSLGLDTAKKPSSE
jgi:DNA-binding NtrC family response regulator